MIDIYVDTSALLPLLDKADDDHSAVVAEVRRLAEVGASLVTTSYTLVEAGALVRNRHAAAEPPRGASLVDWVGFLVMRDRGIEQALALDEDFRRQGFTTLPS